MSSDTSVHSADPQTDITNVGDDDHVADTRRPSCPDICDLPQFEELADPIFVWGTLDGPTCVSAISDSYDVVVHWRPNLFRLPAGRVGEQFIKELSRLFSAFASKSSLESVALKAAFLLPHLILQCSSSKMRPKDISAHIDRRLSQWHEGAFSELLREGQTIQSHLPNRGSSSKNDELARDFDNLMTDGKVGQALRLLTHKSKGRVLDLDSHINPDDPSSSLVRDLLHDKHPPQCPINPEFILSNKTPPDHGPHFVLFDNLNSDLIRQTALRTTGAAGPSGVDAMGWRRFCTSFKASHDLCHSLASVARRLCTSYVHPIGLSAFVAGRLIALDKNPGVRPIGVGEVARRIICKAILTILNPDILDVVGPSQLCAGQDSGCEAAVHTIRHLYSDPNIEGLLLVDASNAFNSLNPFIISFTCAPLLAEF